MNEFESLIEYTDITPVVFDGAMKLVKAGWSTHAAVKTAVETYKLTVAALEKENK